MSRQNDVLELLRAQRAAGAAGAWSAPAYAKASGFKAFAYPVTRQEFRRHLADVLPSVRG